MSASPSLEKKVHLDYSLTGLDSARAVEKGLAEVEWYTTPVPKSAMRALLVRSDGPALRDTALLAALLVVTGAATAALWGTWWAVIPYLIYAVLYGTSSDSRWHECGHGTAFLRFNVRIALPPPGQDCAPGVGSAYVFSLRPGDAVSAIGPFGDFHIKPTQREMVYIGGGAGMAPIRAHLSHLLETENSQRRISYWYGARSRQEIFHQSLFEQMAADHGNFRFHVALSQALPEDQWTGLEGMIHEVVRDRHLSSHPMSAPWNFTFADRPR